MLWLVEVIKILCTRLSAERFGGTPIQKAERLLTCKRDIIVPLEFWFCRNVGLALTINCSYNITKLKLILNFLKKKI